MTYSPSKKGIIHKVPFGTDLIENHPFKSYYPKVKKSLINEENR